MDLSIIIVSWNVREKLKDNLKAIWLSRGDFNFEVFVVDNNSADGSAEMVKQEFPRVKLIANEKNLGFAKANNQAIKYATGRYILLLNPDMKVFPETLENMLGWLDNHKNVWVAGCKLIDVEGNAIKHIRRFPEFLDQLAIVLKLPHLFPEVLKKYLRSDFNYNIDSQADSIRGGFFMIRADIIEKVGLLDERFFLWFEEVDYCRRVKKAGGEVWYTPAAECLDYVGQSFKQLNRGKTQQYFRDSQLKYFMKWQPVWQYRLLKLAWPIGLFLTWLGELLNFKTKAET